MNLLHRVIFLHIMHMQEIILLVIIKILSRSRVKLNFMNHHAFV